MKQFEEIAFFLLLGNKQKHIVYERIIVIQTNNQEIFQIVFSFLSYEKE
jgi:hypothetical protein